MISGACVSPFCPPAKGGSAGTQSLFVFRLAADRLSAVIATCSRSRHTRHNAYMSRRSAAPLPWVWRLMAVKRPLLRVLKTLQGCVTVVPSCTRRLPGLRPVLAEKHLSDASSRAFGRCIGQVVSCEKSLRGDLVIGRRHMLALPVLRVIEDDVISGKDIEMRPMPDNHGVKSLIEPSFADALAAVEAAEDLKEDKRRHLMCSLRIIAKGLGKPFELIPARWTAVRGRVSRLHHTQMGITEKTLANHKGNVRAALNWFSKAEHVPLRGAPFSPDWSKLKHGIGHYRASANLSSLMRYCSARGIDPQDMDEAVLDDLMAYRATTTSLKADAAARRKIARAWNRCIGVVPGWLAS